MVEGKMMMSKNSKVERIEWKQWVKINVNSSWTQVISRMNLSFKKLMNMVMRIVSMLMIKVSCQQRCSRSFKIINNQSSIININYQTQLTLRMLITNSIQSRRMRVSFRIRPNLIQSILKLEMIKHQSYKHQRNSTTNNNKWWIWAFNNKTPILWEITMRKPVFQQAKE